VQQTDPSPRLSGTFAHSTGKVIAAKKKKRRKEGKGKRKRVARGKERQRTMHVELEDAFEWLLSLFYVIVLLFAALLLRRNERNFPDFKIRARLLFSSILLLIGGGYQTIFFSFWPSLVFSFWS
jgi:cytochrome bd-type quinol oxidase subunit 2